MVSLTFVNFIFGIGEGAIREVGAVPAESIRYELIPGRGAREGITRDNSTSRDELPVITPVQYAPSE